NEKDGGKSRKRSRRAPGDGFETRVAQAAEHDDGKKKHQRRKHPLPATDLMVALTQPPKHEECNRCEYSGGSGNGKTGEGFSVPGSASSGDAIVARQPQRAANQ